MSSCIKRESRSRSGSMWTCSCRSRWPQIATLATPGTPSSLGLIVQRASRESSVGSTFLAAIAIIMKRLVVDRGWSIVGGVETFGRVYASVRRSWIICLARMTSVPPWNVRVIDERPVTDFDRIDCSQGMPLNSSSRLSVIRLSTSLADSPIASVWTSTTGAANSGNTSTGMFRSPTAPNATSAAATPTTRKRNCRLEPMIQRNMARSSTYLYLPKTSAIYQRLLRRTAGPRRQ